MRLPKPSKSRLNPQKMIPKLALLTLFLSTANTADRRQNLHHCETMHHGTAEPQCARCSLGYFEDDQGGCLRCNFNACSRCNKDHCLHCFHEGAYEIEEKEDGSKRCGYCPDGCRTCSNENTCLECYSLFKLRDGQKRCKMTFTGHFLVFLVYLFPFICCMGCFFMLAAFVVQAVKPRRRRQRRNLEHTFAGAGPSRPGFAQYRPGMPAQGQAGGAMANTGNGAAMKPGAMVSMTVPFSGSFKAVAQPYNPPLASTAAQGLVIGVGDADRVPLNGLQIPAGNLAEGKEKPVGETGDFNNP